MGEIKDLSWIGEVDESGEYLLQYDVRAEKIRPYSHQCIDKYSIKGCPRTCNNDCGAECCKTTTVPLTEQDIKEGIEHDNGFIRRRTDGSCMYLVDNLCSIYEKRPLACRLFDCSRRSQKDHSAKIVKGYRLKEIMLEQKTTKVVFGVPNEGHTPVEGYDNRMLMAYHLGKFEAQSNGKFEFYFHTAGRLFVPMAREMLCEKALELNADYILMVDDDMIVPHDMFEKLYRHDVDVVGALAFTRNPPHYPVLYTCVEGWDQTSGQEYFINQYVLNYPKDTLVECDAVGFGAVLIKCSLLKKMKKPWFMSTCGSGEDIYWCYKAKREAGARVFMDTSVKLGHIGSPKIIDEAYFIEWNKKENFDKTRALYKGPGIKPLELVEVGINGSK